MAVQIMCINKDRGNHENPYVAISGMGWRNDSGQFGWSTRQQMYDFVLGGGWAYVQAGFNKAYLITRVSPRGTKYVKTIADSTEQDNLLKLLECVG